MHRPRPTTPPAPEAFVFDRVTFPTAGDYLLSFDGEAKAAGGAVNSKTKLTAGGTPKMAAFDARRWGPGALLRCAVAWGVA
jgi:hypothetical protein